MVKSGGSSPLARGLRHERGDDVDRGGIIPARAGFTWIRMAWARWRADHPRSRGVYEAPLTIRISQVGSSPLARGLPAPTPWTAWDRRIIPARAGFTATLEPST